MLAFLLLTVAHQAEATPDKLLEVVLPANTPIKLMLVRPLSSQNSTIGTLVDFALAEDVKDNAGDVLVPAGTTVCGKVTDRESPNLLRWNGLLAIDAEAMCTGPADHLSIVELQIKPNSPKYHDFRIRGKSLGPPAAKPADIAKFTSTQKPTMDKLLSYSDSLHRSPSGAYTNALSTSSAVMLANIIDPHDADKLSSIMQNQNLVASVKSAKSVGQVGKLVKSFGIASAVTLAGIGIGLWELYDLITGFYRQTTFANGTLFDAFVAKEVRVTIVDRRDQKTKGPWHIHVPISKPKKFVGISNVSVDLAPPTKATKARNGTGG